MTEKTKTKKTLSLEMTKSRQNGNIFVKRLKKNSDGLSEGWGTKERSQ